MGITLLVLSSFIVAIFVSVVPRYARKATGWIIALLPIAQFVYLLTFVNAISAGQTFVYRIDWVPTLGVGLSFYVDGLGVLFALLISGIGALIVIYAGGYLEGHPHLGRFYIYLLMFMGSMLGLVLADNVITLFVFWELTSLSSYLLIGFEHERQESRAAALQALLVTGGGGLALMAGLLLLAQVGGTMELSALLNQGDIVRQHSLYIPILLLVLAGAFTKSAQFPFYFWLPSAMEAPTPVSAYLHSATMVKAGIYLMARLSPVLGGTAAWEYLLITAGAITLIVGAGLALFQSDLKRILAYSTVSVLGILTLLIGIDTSASLLAAIVFLVAHSLYKGALFLVAGAVDHETGTRDVTQLGGLRKAMPITAVAAGLAALSMAGLPPLFGFIGKELLYEAELHAPRVAFVIAGIGILGNILLVAIAGIVGIRPFFGSLRKTPRDPHEAPLSLWLGPAILAGLGLVFGILPQFVGTRLIAPALASVRAEPSVVYLSLWHGLNLVLLLSALTLALGVGLYMARSLLKFLSSIYEQIPDVGPARWYEWTLKGLDTLARVQTRVLQSGYLRFYLLMILGTVIGLTGYTFLSRGWFPIPMGLSDIRPHEIIVPALILMAALTAVHAGARLTAVAALGVVGYGIALLYVMFGAPDLAMTQFLIESLTVILLVLVLYHLPKFATLSPPKSRLRDVLIATATGALMTSLVLVATNIKFHAPISEYFAENSLVKGHGRNIVNVILVDFRGLDTLGEITVLALAGLGAFALLKLRLEKRGEDG